MTTLISKSFDNLVSLLRVRFEKYGRDSYQNEWFPAYSATLEQNGGKVKQAMLLADEVLDNGGLASIRLVEGVSVQNEEPEESEEDSHARYAEIADILAAVYGEQNVFAFMDAPASEKPQGGEDGKKPTAGSSTPGTIAPGQKQVPGKGPLQEAHLLEMVKGSKNLLWDTNKHPRGKDGTFIERNSAEAVQAAHDKVGLALKNPKTPEGMKELVEHLNLLTVNQLHDLKKKYKITASARRQHLLVQKLADRLDRGRREPGEHVGDDKQAQPQQKQADAEDKQSSEPEQATKADVWGEADQPYDMSADDVSDLAHAVNNIQHHGVSVHSMGPLMEVMKKMPDKEKAKFLKNMGFPSGANPTLAAIVHHVAVDKKLNAKAVVWDHWKKDGAPEEKKEEAAPEQVKKGGASTGHSVHLKQAAEDLKETFGEVIDALKEGNVKEAHAALGMVEGDIHQLAALVDDMVGTPYENSTLHKMYQGQVKDALANVKMFEEKIKKHEEMAKENEPEEAPKSLDDFKKEMKAQGAKVTQAVKAAHETGDKDDIDHAGEMIGEFNDMLQAGEQFKKEAFYGLQKNFGEASMQMLKQAVEAYKANKSSKPAKKNENPKGMEWLPGGFKYLGSPGGSTGAALVEDENGEKWIAKKGAHAKHLVNEIGADKAYEVMGLPVPEIKLHKNDKGETVKMGKYLEGSEDLGAWWEKATPEQRKSMKAEIQKGFTLDALLGNWDVVGLDMDNIRIHDGKAYRVDNGGTFDTRAQGAQKTEDQWNGKGVPELGTMMDPNISPNAAKIFKGIPHPQLVKQVQQLAKKANQLLGAVPDDQKEVFLERLEAMADEFGVTMPEIMDDHAEAMFGKDKGQKDDELLAGAPDDDDDFEEYGTTKAEDISHDDEDTEAGMDKQFYGEKDFEAVKPQDDHGSGASDDDDDMEVTPLKGKKLKTKAMYDEDVKAITKGHMKNLPGLLNEDVQDMYEALNNMMQTYVDGDEDSQTDAKDSVKALVAGLPGGTLKQFGKTLGVEGSGPALEKNVADAIIANQLAYEQGGIWKNPLELLIQGKPIQFEKGFEGGKKQKVGMDSWKEAMKAEQNPNSKPAKPVSKFDQKIAELKAAKEQKPDPASKEKAVKFKTDPSPSQLLHGLSNVKVGKGYTSKTAAIIHGFLTNPMKYTETKMQMAVNAMDPEKASEVLKAMVPSMEVPSIPGAANSMLETILSKSMSNHGPAGSSSPAFNNIVYKANHVIKDKKLLNAINMVKTHGGLTLSANVDGKKTSLSDNKAIQHLVGQLADEKVEKALKAMDAKVSKNPKDNKQLMAALINDGLADYKVNKKNHEMATHSANDVLNQDKEKVPKGTKDPGTAWSPSAYFKKDIAQYIKDSKSLGKETNVPMMYFSAKSHANAEKQAGDGEHDNDFRELKEHLEEQGWNMSNLGTVKEVLNTMYSYARDAWESDPEQKKICPPQHTLPEPKEQDLIGSKFTKKDLDANEYKAVQTYTREGYTYVNAFLRGEEAWNAYLKHEYGNTDGPMAQQQKKQAEKIHTRLKSVFQYTKPLPKPIKVFRGFSFDRADALHGFLENVKKSHKQGKVMRLDGYVSTCKTGIAPGFKGPVVAVIEAIQGYNADADGGSSIPSEQEFLLNHGCDYEIVKYDTTPEGFTTLHLRQLNNGQA